MNNNKKYDTIVYNRDNKRSPQKLNILQLLDLLESESIFIDEIIINCRIENEHYLAFIERRKERSDPLETTSYVTGYDPNDDYLGDFQPITSEQHLSLLKDVTQLMQDTLLNK